MAVDFDFLHIKSRTAGSSNELSFDVLEHKSAEADGKAPRSPAYPMAPKASQGSYHGVSGTSTLSGQAEVEKRKKARRSYRIRLRVVAAIAVVALIGIGVYMGMSIHEQRMDFADRVGLLVERLEGVDRELVEIDEMMADPFNEEEGAARKEALSKIPRLTTELNRISVDAQSLAELAGDDRSRGVVDHIGKAALARNGMMSVAGEAFRLSTEASEQTARSDEVWTNVLNADQQAREAISAANKATKPEAASSALESLRSSKEGFEAALAEMQDLSATYGADLSAQQAYLEKKIEALGYAAETSEALLAGNRDAAKEANGRYNEADEEAAQLAANLPPSPSGAVQSCFESMMDGYLARYNEARNRTVEADSVIREYLG